MSTFGYIEQVLGYVGSNREYGESTFGHFGSTLGYVFWGLLGVLWGLVGVHIVMLRVFRHHLEKNY